MSEKVPKYAQLMDWIEAQIASGDFGAGDKFYSENEMSARFHLSRHTVRQAISLLEQKQVLERRQGSGTYVKRKKVARRDATMNIGIVSTYLDHYIFPSIITGVENILTASGYKMQMALTYNRLENERKALRSMIDSGVDGMIIEPTKSALPTPNVRLYQQLQEEDVPFVLFNAYYPHHDFPFVSMDDRVAGQVATSYLLEEGHRKIFSVMESDNIQGPLRYEGFLRAMTEANVEIYSERSVWFDSEEKDSFVYDEKRVLDRIKDCTAIVCYNDELAFHIIRMLRKHGVSVPDDVSVIGFDNSDMASLCEVPITSVAHPGSILGEAAALKLLRMIDGSDRGENVLMTPEIVVRDSVKAMPTDV